MSAYYNEIDPFSAAWLRELIKSKLIADGEVDERSIEDVLPNDLRGFSQCHFFAGIGVWSYALRCAGWPDDRPVWTGSCPCQSFSAAGKGDGFADERHLWPAWFHLIEQCRPPIIFGEQVEAAIKKTWLDLVSSDMEGIGYSFGAIISPAAGYGAPHQRHRIYFVADSSDSERRRRTESEQNEQRPSDGSGHGVVLGDTIKQGLEGHSGDERVGNKPGRIETDEARSITKAGEPCNGFWSDAIFIPCRYGKARPTKPGIFPLAHGAPARVGRVRGYGNCIVAPQAEEFIKAVMEYLKSHGG